MILKIAIHKIFILILFSYQAYSEDLSKSLTLKLYNFEIGNFEYSHTIKKNVYIINTNGKIRNLFFLRNFNVSSGSVGTFDRFNNLMPLEASFKWSLNGNYYQNKLFFENQTIVNFVSTGSPDFLKTDFNPISLEGVIDPISALFYFLKESKFENTCDYKISIVDGFRQANVFFNNKKIKSNNEIICEGTLERINGFKRNIFYRRNSRFSIFYNLNEKGTFQVKKLWFNTFLGKIYVEVHN